MESVMRWVKRHGKVALIPFLAFAILAGGAALSSDKLGPVGEAVGAENASAAVGGTCAQAAKVAWANKWNPWPPKYVVMAMGMAAACGYWVGGLWGQKAQKAWNTCWPNCPWWYSFKFW